MGRNGRRRPATATAATGAAPRKARSSGARRAVIGITLEQLADATGISRSALSRIKRDELGTSLNYGLAIAQALGCDLFELLQGRICIGAAGQRLHLRAGDTATLQADTEHRFRNTGQGIARLMLLECSPRRWTNAPCLGKKEYSRPSEILLF